MSKSIATNTDLVRTYLNEIGRTPLLTEEQEIALGRQVQKMNRAIALTKKSPEKSDVELERTIAIGHRARNKLVESNLRLVISVAKRYQNRGLELLDLIQEGALGLTRAAEKFEPARGYRFSTYAYHWIRQAMTRSLGMQSRTIRLPCHVVEQLNQVKKKQSQLSQQLKRTPTVEEIAAALNKTPEKIRDLLNCSRQTTSLDMELKNDGDTQLIDLIGSTANEVEDCNYTDLTPTLAVLNPQQRQIVSWRYGLDDGKELSLAKISAKINLSRERVRQIEKKSLEKLQSQQKI